MEEISNAKSLKRAIFLEGNTGSPAELFGIQMTYFGTEMRRRELSAYLFLEYGTTAISQPEV